MLRLILFMFSVLLLGACSLRSPTAVNGPPLPAHFSTLQNSTPVADPVRENRWWLSLRDSNLEALLARAFEGNLALAQALARLEQLEALAVQSGASRWPTLGLDGQLKREGQPGLVGDFTGDSRRLSLAASFEIDLWEKYKSRQGAAQGDAKAGEAELEAHFLRLSAQVADLYYLAAEQQVQLELTDRTVSSLTESLDLVERRYNAGLAPAVDLYQARQNLASAKTRRPQQQTILAGALNALAVLLGRMPGAAELGDIPRVLPMPAAFSAGLPSELLAHRPDVTAALARVGAADQRVAAAIADRFPSFNLLGGYGLSRSEVSAGVLRGDFWSLALGLTQPLIDGGRRKAEVTRNEAVLSERLAAYRQAVLTAVKEVEDALAANQGSEERIALLKDRVEASEASNRLAMERYRQGLSDYLPVLTAQSLLFDAQAQLVSARRQLIVDRVSLARALGGEWMSSELNNYRQPARIQQESRL